MADEMEQEETKATGGKVLPFCSGIAAAALGPKKAICIPCAVRSDKFRERAPVSSRTPLDGGGDRRAWIDGRGYRVFHNPVSKILCFYCGREVPVAYVPDEGSAA
jgi:hypothetical protein